MKKQIDCPACKDKMNLYECAVNNRWYWEYRCECGECVEVCNTCGQEVGSCYFCKMD